MSDNPLMVEHLGIYLPAGETHLQPHMTASPLFDGAGTYQLAKLRTAVDMLPLDRRRKAVDIGAHVGLWSRVLASLFETVECFEPVPWHRACWAKNMSGFGDRVRLLPYAASDHYGTVNLTIAADNSGSTRIAPGGSLPAQTIKVDDCAFQAVDFIKADCEGWEEPALRGMSETIGRCLPIIICEQKPGHAERAGLRAQGAVHFLNTVHDYRIHTVMSGDYIMTPPGWQAPPPPPV